MSVSPLGARVAIALGCAFWASLAWIEPAGAAPLSDGEMAALEHGDVIRKPLDAPLEGGEYFGGVAYVIVHAAADRVMQALVDPASYRRILPLTLDAHVVEQKGGLVYLFLRQGGRLGSAGYTVIVRRESPRLVRFWLDPARPHDIADCWGFFRIDPIDGERSLLRFGALVRLDFGVTKMLFTEKIRGYALDTPDLVRRFVEAKQDSPRSW